MAIVKIIQLLAFSSQLKTVFSLRGHSVVEMHSDKTSRPKVYCAVIDLRTIASKPYVKDISGTGHDGHSIGAASNETFSHAHLLHPGKCHILGTKTFKQKTGSQSLVHNSNTGLADETKHTPPYWRNIHRRFVRHVRWVFYLPTTNRWPKRSTLQYSQYGVCTIYRYSFGLHNSLS